MGSLLRLLDRIIEAAAVLAFAASSMLILVNVINRYLVLGFMREMSRSHEDFDPVYRFFRELLGNYSVMADEVPGYLLVWIAFLGAYLVLRREGHIAFTMLLEALPRSWQIALNLINTLLMSIFLAMLFIQSVRMIEVSGATEIETAEIAQGWFMLIIPLAAALFLLAILLKILEQLCNKTDKAS